MNIPVGRSYRLVGRGGTGLTCDQEGVALGGAGLVRARLDGSGRRRCEVRSPREIGEVLRAAYGAQPDEVVSRCHRGLRRAAAWIETGDLGRAGIEAVMIGLPDLTPEAVTTLARIADLQKGGAAWEDEPRIPAGQPGGGQWTTGGVAPTANIESPKPPFFDHEPALQPAVLAARRRGLSSRHRRSAVNYCRRSGRG